MVVVYHEGDERRALRNSSVEASYHLLSQQDHCPMSAI